MIALMSSLRISRTLVSSMVIALAERGDPSTSDTSPKIIPEVAVAKRSDFLPGLLGNPTSILTLPAQII